MAVVPDGYQGPQLNILPAQFLLSHGCILDFTRERSRIFFRWTSREAAEGATSLYGRFCLAAKDCRRKASHQLLLDTGSPRNAINASFLEELRDEPRAKASGKFRLQLYRNQKRADLSACDVIITNLGDTKFLLGSDFLRQHRALCDLGTKQLYVAVGGQYYCLRLTSERSS